MKQIVDENGIALEVYAKVVESKGGRRYIVSSIGEYGTAGGSTKDVVGLLLPGSSLSGSKAMGVEAVGGVLEGFASVQVVKDTRKVAKATASVATPTANAHLDTLEDLRDSSNASLASCLDSTSSSNTFIANGSSSSVAGSISMDEKFCMASRAESYGLLTSAKLKLSDMFRSLIASLRRERSMPKYSAYASDKSDIADPFDAGDSTTKEKP